MASVYTRLAEQQAEQQRKLELEEQRRHEAKEEEDKQQRQEHDIQLQSVLFTASLLEWSC